jgi:hypothetical protein
MDASEVGVNDRAVQRTAALYSSAGAKSKVEGADLSTRPAF